MIMMPLFQESSDKTWIFQDIASDILLSTQAKHDAVSLKMYVNKTNLTMDGINVTAMVEISDKWGSIQM